MNTYQDVFLGDTDAQDEWVTCTVTIDGQQATIIDPKNSIPERTTTLTATIETLSREDKKFIREYLSEPRLKVFTPLHILLAGFCYEFPKYVSGLPETN